MSASFTKSGLISRSIRRAVTDGSGIRKIDFSDLIDRKRGLGGIVKAIWRGGKALLGWAASALFGAFSFSDAVGWLQDKVYELAEFDWNSSDEELKALIYQEELQIYSQFGSFVGAGLGWVTSIALGYGVALSVPVIGGAQLAKLATAAVTDEAAADMLGRLKGTTRAAGGGVAKIAAMWLFVQSRRGLRQIPAFKNWGRPDGPRFVISEKYEDAVQNIPFPRLRAFIQGASGGFEDSFFDGLYIMAASLDDQVAIAKEAATLTMGVEREVTLYPDHRTEEKIVLRGPEKLLGQQIQEQISSHRRLADKDVGVIIGEDAKNAIRTAPQRRVLRVVYKNRSKPPWESRSDDFKTSILQVPDLKRTSWEELKRVLKPFTWGRFYHCIPLDNGRKILSHGNSPGEARENAERLLSLSTASPLSNRITGEQDDSNIYRRKRAVRLYPVAAIVELKRPAPQSESSYTDPAGRSYKIQRTRFNLWPSSQPKDLPQGL